MSRNGKQDGGLKGCSRVGNSSAWLDLRLVFMSGAYAVELGSAPTWRMYSWHSAWYCQSHRLLPKSPPPPAPSSKSYTPVLWREKGKKHSWNMKLSHTVQPYVCVSKVNTVLLGLKKVSYNEATDTNVPPASVQDTDGFCQWYFMDFRMAKVLTFYILQTKNLKIWPEYWLSQFALYMQLTHSGLIEICRLRMSVY